MSDLESLRDRVAALERRLADVEASAAIQNLKSEYGALADARYTTRGVVEASELARLADEIAALFSEDGVWDGGAGLGRCQGREAIAARFREPTLLFSWHYFVKPRIVVDGDRAQGTWDILAPCTSAEGRPMWMAGVEEDEYVREGGRWLHSAMRLRVVFMAPHEMGWAPRKPPSPPA